jgi:uncharacterized membrane protein YraQ (UPF0718 family)
MDVVKILVLLTTVIYLMGWLRALLTPERVRAMMKGRSGPGARLMAVGLGAVTPFCSCSSIPLFIGFVEAGIPLGVTLSFLIASPMVNQVAVVVLAGVIGWQMTLIYVFTGLSIAFVGGYILQAFRLERWVEDYVWQIRMGETQAEAADTSLRARHDYAWNEVRQIVGRIWKYVLIGVGIGALIHGYVPQDFVARIAGDGSVLSVIVAVLVGIPMYSDAVGIIPVAEALLGKGVPLGTVLAFMMAVIALSLPEMLILRKVAKWPLLGIFAGYLAVSFVLVGVTVQRFEECPVSESNANSLHPSIVALVSLAANIAANHPKQGLCQVDRLKEYGVAKEQIDAVIEIARHIRDEAAQALDASFDEAYEQGFQPAKPKIKVDPFANIAVVEGGACCTPTKSGQSCC